MREGWIIREDRVEQNRCNGKRRRLKNSKGGGLVPSCPGNYITFVSWLEQNAASIWAPRWTGRLTFSHCRHPAAPLSSRERHLGTSEQNKQTIQKKKTTGKKQFKAFRRQIMIVVSRTFFFLRGIPFVSDTLTVIWLRKKKIILLPRTADITTTTGCPTELQQVLCRTLWSPPQTAGITKGQSLLFYSVDKSPFVGVRGEGLGGDDLWWVEAEKSLFMAGERFDSGTKATSSPSRLKEAEIRGVRKPNWMLGQLGTPPANAACTLHRKKHLIIMISREAAEGHIFVAFAANVIKIYFAFLQNIKTISSS